MPTLAPESTEPGFFADVKTIASFFKPLAWFLFGVLCAGGFGI